MGNLRRRGVMRTRANISVLNPMPDEFKTNVLKPGHYVFDGNTFVPYDEYHSRQENNAPAVMTDEKWVSQFDWGAGKNWKDHGGRAGRREWMRRDGIQEKG